MAEGHELRLEIFERALLQCSTVGTQLGLPVVGDVTSELDPKLFLTWWLLEKEEWVRKIVGVAERSYLRKPALTALSRRSKKLNCNLMKNVTREATDHSK